MIRVKENVCGNIHSAMLREYIDTNGKGGYCSSTIVGMNTRRYHGLLVCALNPPVDRHVIVSKVEETLVVNGDKYSISCNQYPNSIYPDGHKYLKEFRLTPFPKFIYEINNLYRIEKTVFMIHNKNATAIRYVFFPAEGEIEFYVRPMLAFRHFHHLQKSGTHLISDINVTSKAVKITPANMDVPLYIYHGADTFKIKGFWYNNFEYREEVYRGYECHEDLYSPGHLIYTFAPADHYEAWMVCSTEPLLAVDINSIQESEISRRSRLVRNMETDKELLEPLIFAADSFICQKHDKPNSTIVAGYHWFTDWTRDTMVSIPGLTLATGRFDVAKQILNSYSDMLFDGLMPNFFGDDNQPIYNTVDASLWFIYAVYKYLQYTDDNAFLPHILPSLKNIMDKYLHGTRFGIKTNEFSLITFDEERIPLTWMDAIGSDSRAKARKGMVVEVNALWYNAVKVMEQIMTRLGYLSDAAEYHNLGEVIMRNFNQVFWNGKSKYLYDFVDGDYKETALRPNQILACGLPFAVLFGHLREPVISIVRDKLLTPYGLRTLSPDHPCFAPYYRGGEKNRNIAYHQGTVWTWLLGFYISAYIKTYGKTDDSINYAKSLISPFREHLIVGGMGTVSEIFDGTVPYYFRGCISQAWSVAEILRAYAEEILAPENKPAPILNKEKTARENFSV